jgi:hypothetical protein
MEYNFDFEVPKEALGTMSALETRVMHAGDELETSARDIKHKREVCRYWLHSKCMKGRQCEFLHALDYAKMPNCPMGDTCTAGNECPFKHLDPQRPECANYQLGFCSFGRRCPHRHVVRGPEELPEISPYWGLPSTVLYAAHVRAQQMSQESNFRKKKCEYYHVKGWCPYFDMCNFSH